MPRLRLVLGSFMTVAGLGLFCAVVSADQQSVQKLIERGALQEAVDRAGEDPESTYLAAQALIKMDNNGGAGERFGRLREGGNDAWKAIGESGAKSLGGDTDGAMEAANRAVDADGGNPYAHYQLGLIAARQNNFQRSLEAFSRAVEIKPDFAYAHYYAGQAAQRLRQTSKVAEHFTVFVKLAPDSPERQSVQAILRALR